ncbi:MAG: DUF3570 domain-containing protein [Sandaracinaceae bacterium]|nr:DUF3570 domain-containing protein [Sandaracinaceae bacterium]MDW8245188.1 DUF3570 domain-containing protein [Sandaracinaceae bacterium]
MHHQVVLADEASGTWTGELRFFGNYYWETSTRVVAPEIGARIVSPEGVEVDIDYLVDAITSASIAAGVIEDIRFTEVRNQGTVSIGREFDLGEAQVRIGAFGRMSHEPDYFAAGIGGSSSISFNQRSTVVSLQAGYIHDDVGAVLRGGNQLASDPSGRNLSNRGRVGILEGFNLSLSAQQVVTPTLWLSGGYDFVSNQGFLANPYRSVMVQGVLSPEVHPNARARHTLWGRLAYFFEFTKSAIHLLFRSYFDDWRVSAINPEVRFYQEIGELLTLRLRYRFYHQSASFFWKPPADYVAEDPFVTADPKMASFSSHLFGVRIQVGLAFLAQSILDFASRGSFELNFEHLWQGSRFGDAIIAQSGIRLPF